MTIGQRIKHLRKDILKLNQEEFSKRINISRSNLGNIEIQKVNTTDRVVTDICREYKVNEDWLYNGIEPIFLEAKDNIDDEILKLYAMLTKDNQMYLKGYMQRLFEEQSKK